MLILGIDPGSTCTGWALLESSGNKIKYFDSGVLKFDTKTDFLNRLSEIKFKMQEILENNSPDEIALESLIYVKSPTALIKLAQTRGVLLSTFIDDFQGRIYEYSPNLIKSTAVGHGHADKQSVQKVLDMILGPRKYATHDESDAVAIAFCHALNRNKNSVNSSASSGRKARGSGMQAALAHKIKEI